MYDSKSNPSKFCQLNTLKAGDQVVLDRGFTCMPAGPATVAADADGELYIPCAEGKHRLDGQVDGEYGVCVGIWRPEDAPSNL